MSTAYGQIVGGGRSYQITPDDVLWMARAVHCEGGDPAATMWTYAWRLIVKRWRGSLVDLLRAHSQPINPNWDDASDPFCQRWPERCTAAQLARRARCANARWEDLPEDIRSKVLIWARAGLRNPAPGSTDFADPQVSRSFLSRPANQNAQVVLRAGNWYIAEHPELPADHVTVRYGGRTAGAGPVQPGSSTGSRVGLVVVAAIAGVGAYWIASRWG